MEAGLGDKQRTAAYWKNLHDKWESSNIKKSKFCKIEDVSYSKFKYYSRKFKAQNTEDTGSPNFTAKKSLMHHSPVACSIIKPSPVNLACSKAAFPAQPFAKTAAAGKFISLQIEPTPSIRLVFPRGLSLELGGLPSAEWLTTVAAQWFSLEDAL